MVFSVAGGVNIAAKQFQKIMDMFEFTLYKHLCLHRALIVQHFQMQKKLYKGDFQLTELKVPPCSH